MGYLLKDLLVPRGNRGPGETNRGYRMVGGLVDGSSSPEVSM